MDYSLAAHSTDGKRTESIAIYAENNIDATIQAISFILDESMHNDLWAKGRIVLLSPEGNTIQTMEPKG